MNKILKDGEKYFLNINDTEITIKDSATIYIFNNKDIDLNITLEENAYLYIYDYNVNSKTTNIVTNQSNNTSFNYIHTFNIEDKYEFNYLANINGNNNVNNINISGVSKGFVSMNVDAKINQATRDNEVNENIKVLTLGGKAFISPMLHVSALNVIANHNTAISNINQDELFYLESKGIDKDKAISLITNGYIFGPFKDNEEFLNIIK